MLQSNETALILIGFQNDYFSPSGILHGVLETPERASDVLARTVSLVEQLAPTGTTIINTPILFTEDYAELVDPVGILKVIREVGAFRRDTPGGATVPELEAFGDRIEVIPGKRGLNAFSNTDLDTVLRGRGIRNVILAGVVTSVCVDSTGRAASERGYQVVVLSDCTAGRTALEQDFYCREVFPLYATVATSGDVVAELTACLATTTSHPA